MRTRGGSSTIRTDARALPQRTPMSPSSSKSRSSMPVVSLRTASSSRCTSCCRAAGAACSARCRPSSGNAMASPSRVKSFVLQKSRMRHTQDFNHGADCQIRYRFERHRRREIDKEVRRPVRIVDRRRVRPGLRSEHASRRQPGRQPAVHRAVPAYPDSCCSSFPPAFQMLPAPRTGRIDESVLPSGSGTGPPRASPVRQPVCVRTAGQASER